MFLLKSKNKYILLKSTPPPCTIKNILYNSLTFHLQAFVLKYQLNFSNKSRKHPCWIQHISNSVYTCIQDKGTLSQEIWRNCWGVNNGRSLAFCAELRFSVQQKSKTRAEILSSTEIHNQSWDSQYHRNTHLELIFSVLRNPQPELRFTVQR